MDFAHNGMSQEGLSWKIDRDWICVAVTWAVNETTSRLAERSKGRFQI